MFDLKKLLAMSFVPNYMVGEEGAPSGTDQFAGSSDMTNGRSEGSSELPPENNSETEYDLPTDLDIPEEQLRAAIESDPEFKSRLITKKKNSSQKDIVDEVSEDDQDVDSGESENKADESVADDKNSGESSSSVEFDDNVIDGLKGEHFAKLPEEAQEAIGKFYTSAKENETKYTEAKKQLDELLEDPVVKARVELKAHGKENFDVRGFTQLERQDFISKVSAKYGLDQTEATELFNDYSNGLTKIAHDMAHDIANNLILHNENQRKASEISKKGAETLLSIAQFNPELAVKETDLNKFYIKNPNGSWAYNDKHPEIEKFKKGIGQAQSLFAKYGFDYQRITEMGPKKLYAIAADEFNWPVAFNTGARDSKIAMEARKKALEPFIKSSARSLSSKSGAPATRQGSDSVIIDGYDAVKLNTDPDYYRRAVEKKPGNLDHLEKISAIAAKGKAQMLAKKK